VTTGAAGPARRGRRLSLLTAVACLALLLALALPLFLCMPLTPDATLYDLCVRNLQRGGVHYRDVFDTNLPGMVWLHLLARSAFGWSSESLRAVDFCVVSASVWLLAWWAPGPRSLAGRVWTAVALYAFYFSTSEVCHCQRDGWMLLPALVSLWLRRRQVGRLAAAPAPWGGVLGMAALEGACWGAAVWVKPFVLLPALAAWLAGAWLLARSPGRSIRLLAADGLGLLAGGLAAGALGVAWLKASGAWPYFLDILLDWNREYYRGRDVVGHLKKLPGYLWPWGLMHVAAVPVAAFRLVAALAARRGAGLPPGWRQALLAALYLGWLGQVVGFQYGFYYQHVPAMLLALAVLAGGPPAAGRLPVRRLAALGWLAVACFAALAAWHHPVLRRDRVAVWGRCLREGSTPELRDRLALTIYVEWSDLERVADYLRGQDLADGELTCADWRVNSLYLELNVAPSTRYIYLNVMYIFFPRHFADVQDALAGTRQRYLVADLCLGGLTPAQAREERPGRPLALPPAFGPDSARLFPFSEPMVFRAGRYAVYRIDHPGRRFYEKVSEAAPGVAKPE